jgi:TetR/AcrR family transcriptional regulator
MKDRPPRPARQPGTDNHTRAAILDAAEAIMRDEGYAAVSSRKVASRADLKSQLVHYYFATMDDLFLALFRRVEERHFARLATAVTAKAPLRALWALCIDAGGPRLTREFVAMATHRDALRHEIARSAERTRGIFVAALSRAVEDRGLPADAWPPIVLAMLMDGAARLILSDRMLGTAMGHDETLAFIERQLALIDRAPA